MTNAFVSVQCTNLDLVFDVIKWAHHRRRQWIAKTESASWTVEVEVIRPGEAEEIKEVAEVEE